MEDKKKISLSIKSQAQIKSDMVREHILESVIAFIPASPNARADVLLQNIVYKLSSKLDNIAVIDFNIQNPTLCIGLGVDTASKEKLPLSDRFNSTEDKDVTLFFNDTMFPNVKYIGAKPKDDKYSYHSLGDPEALVTFIDTIKRRFDYVLILADTHLWSLPFLTTLQHCDRGYWVWDESRGCPPVTADIQAAFKSTVNFSKFKSVIFHNMLSQSYGIEALSRTSLGVTPLVSIGFERNAVEAFNLGKVYLRGDGLSISKQYEKGVQVVLKELESKF